MFLQINNYAFLKKVYKLIPRTWEGGYEMY